jgi:hypothetical protein
MKKLITSTFLLLFTSTFVVGQEENLDKQLGLRVKKNGNDYLIYADEALTPNFDDYRKINYQVYFRKVDFPEKDISGVKYQLITIPGTSKKQEQNDVKILADGSKFYPRAGKTVNSPDYDSDFWIKVKDIEDNTNPEYYKYANDVFSGLLTAPFKYRLKTGNAPEAILDGDFNIALIGKICLMKVYQF